MADHDGAYIHLIKARADRDPAQVVGLNFDFAIICGVVVLANSPESIFSSYPIMIVVGSTSIGNRATPRRLKMPLNCPSPANKRLRYFD